MLFAIIFCSFERQTFYPKDQEMHDQPTQKLDFLDAMMDTQTAIRINDMVAGKKLRLQQMMDDLCLDTPDTPQENQTSSFNDDPINGLYDQKNQISDADRSSYGQENINPNISRNSRHEPNQNHQYKPQQYTHEQSYNDKRSVLPNDPSKSEYRNTNIGYSQSNSNINQNRHALPTNTEYYTGETVQSNSDRVGEMAQNNGDRVGDHSSIHINNDIFKENRRSGSILQNFGREHQSETFSSKNINTAPGRDQVLEATKSNNMIIDQSGVGRQQISNAHSSVTMNTDQRDFGREQGQTSCQTATPVKIVQFDGNGERENAESFRINLNYQSTMGNGTEIVYHDSSLKTMDHPTSLSDSENSNNYPHMVQNAPRISDKYAAIINGTTTPLPPKQTPPFKFFDSPIVNMTSFAIHDIDSAATLNRDPIAAPSLNNSIMKHHSNIADLVQVCIKIDVDDLLLQEAEVEHFIDVSTPLI